VLLDEPDPERALVVDGGVGEGSREDAPRVTEGALGLQPLGEGEQVLRGRLFAAEDALGVADVLAVAGNRRGFSLRWLPAS
jgi:hypothetical protein